MSYSRYPFLFFLLDTPTGLCYYKDANGNTQKANIQSGTEIALANKTAPDGWMNSELGFNRNKDYYALFRSYNSPYTLVKDAEQIVREIYYSTKGSETLLSYMILKYNDQPQSGEPQYELYYKSPIDFSQSVDTIVRGFQISLFQGGITQLIKAYENTIFEIPCDGSIPENIKALFDGMLVEDTLYYSIPQISLPSDGHPYILPCTKTDEDGDSYGVVSNGQTLEDIDTTSNYATTQNYLFSSVAAVTVRVRGTIELRPFSANHPVGFALALQTPVYANEGLADQFLHTELLVPSQKQGRSTVSNPYGAQLFPNNHHQSYLTGQSVYSFDQTIDLQANENLFLAIAQFGDPAHPLTVLSGNFTVEFVTAPQNVSVWMISLYNIGKLLLKYICQYASTTDYPLAFQFISSLLEGLQNLCATSGDALRAAGDPNYSKFYNAAQTNINYPNINLTGSYGVVLKTSLKDWFQNASCILMAAMGAQQPGSMEELFFEQLEYVFNATSVSMDLGEVADMKLTRASDLFFTRVKFGWNPALNDQKSGKFSWISTLEMQGPMKAIPDKVFEKVSPWNACPYIMQRLIANINDTSTTRNANDNTVHNVNIDLNNWTYDTWTASFLSLIQNTSIPNNTNIYLLPNVAQQPISMFNIQGGYFYTGKDFSIFVFCVPSFSSSLAMRFQLSGTLNQVNPIPGNPNDYAIVTLWINGVAAFTQTINYTSAGTPISIDHTITQVFNFKDCVYITIDTSASGEVDDIVASITAGTYWSASGANIQVLAGSNKKLISLPNVIPTSQPFDNSGTPGVQSVVQYGFQYFQFNSQVINPTFAMKFLIRGLTNGASGQNATFDYWRNGQVKNTITANSAGTLTNFPALPATDFEFDETVTFQLGDIIFLTGSAQNTNAFITEMSLTATSTNIKAYNLYREQYDALSGLPNLLGNIPGTNKPLTTGPGAYFNITPYSPKRMFLAWKKYLDSVNYYQRGNKYSFLTISKNKFLSTTLNGVTITEAADEPVGSDILFIPEYADFTTEVQRTFASIMTGAANAHIRHTYIGNEYFSFPDGLKQHPGTNESQEWKTLLSPQTNIATLINPSTDGIKLLDMPANSIVWAKGLPIQLVVEGQTQDPQINTNNRYQYWFSEQVSRWVNQNNYGQYWQNNDTISLQFLTNGLSNVIARIYNCSQAQIGIDITIPEITSAAVASPYSIFQGNIDISGLSAGTYFIEIVAGSGGSQTKLISEPLLIASSWPNTVLIKYSCSYNTQNLIFTDTNYQPQIRVDAILGNRFTRKFKRWSFVDQVQDAKTTQAYPYDVCKFWLGTSDGVPFWVHQKVSDALLMDQTTIENEGLTYDTDSDGWEETFIEGNPKRFFETTLRCTQNLFANVATSAGASGDTSIIATVDAVGFGPNINNDSNATETDIIGILIN
ncbi:MAG: hypothetical protein JST87_05240 [Bacteroidetes bacterium]|nr:hypothetical protein [Bacteroidota bacterium]